MSGLDDRVVVRFSNALGIDASLLRRYGAFDVSLVTDLPLFIDPFLLFNSRKSTYQKLHKRIIEYLKFLRDRSTGGRLDSGLVDSWYRFPEVKQTWLGFTRSGNDGRGLGRDFANALFANLASFFSDFGKESITKDSHLEKLCLVGRGVGRDSISDFTTNLIKEYLLSYTETFARKHLSTSQCHEFSVTKVRFNYRTESWESGTYYLPIVNGDYVLLTPRDMLTRDETWINRAELIHDFRSLPDAIPNAALRAEINNYFQNLLTGDATRKELDTAAVRTLHKFPILVDYYIKRKEDEGGRATSESNFKVAQSEQLYIHQFGELAGLLRKSSGFYDSPGNTCEEARQRVNFLKDVIENKGGHRLFYLNGEPLEREEDIHVAYRLTWFGTVSDVSREVNDGRGPADFKISRGSVDKAIVEFKLASNTQLKRNLRKQAEIYEKASDAKCSIKVIVFFTEPQFIRVMKILKDLNLTHSNDIVLIDARKENKPSGSKAA
jgi:hypothetical protein